MATLTSEHFHAFGYFINMHAAIERGFSIYIENLTGLNRVAAHIMTEPYTANKYIEVIKALVSTFEEDEETKKNIIEIVDRWSGEKRLRNQIAHQGLWVKGKSPGSIKPYGLTIGGGKLKLFGAWEEEEEITLEQLESACRRLDDIKSDLVAMVKGFNEASELTASE